MVNFSEIIKRKGTYSTKFDYTYLKFQKKDLDPFWISDMDFKAPKEILDALHKRVDHGIFGYSKWENNDYINAICHWYKKRFNLEIDTTWIAYCTGVIFCIQNLLRIINPNRENVLFITPAFDGFFNMLNFGKYPTLTSHMIETSVNNYTIDFDDFENKCKASKVFILCNPNNPNGKLWNKEEIKKIIEICKKHNVLIISDDVYMDLVFEEEFVPIFKIAKELDYLDKTFIISTYSKTFNMPSLGGAFALIPDKKIHQEFVEYNTFVNNLNSPIILSVIALIEGYNNCDYWVEAVKDYFLHNFKIIDEFLKREITDIKFEIPKASYFAWLDCSNLGFSQEELQNKLIHNSNLAIMPSHFYGEEKAFLRFNIACADEVLKKGLQKFKEALY